MCGWVPSAWQVSLSVSVCWGDTEFYATVRPLPVGTVGTWLLAVVEAVSVRRRFAVTAAAAFLSVCGGVRFGWCSCCPLPRWPRW